MVGPLALRGTMPKRPKRKKHQKRKKRTEYIYGTTVGEVNELIVTVDEHTGEIQFGGAMMNTYSEISYERPKGPKIISRIPQADRSLSFDTSAALTKNYDFLCAVDTNTRIIRGQKIAVVGVVVFKEGVPPAGATEYWHLDVPFCWEFVGIKVDKPENFGWLAAWEELSRRRLVTPLMRVGMVVDSDLGSISDYNSRQKPFFEERVLPSNVQLIYASADTGSDILVNKVLKIADSASSQVLDALESGNASPNTKKRDSPYFDGVRIVNPYVDTFDPEA